MRRLRKSELLAIQMVAELVAERRKERPKRSDALLDRCPHPDADELLIEAVISKKLRPPLAFSHTDRPRPKHPHWWRRDTVELGSRGKKPKARLPHQRRLLGAHRLPNRLRRSQQAI